jgi:hypothetical protein
MASEAEAAPAWEETAGLASEAAWEEAAAQPLRPGRCVVLPRSVWGLGATERG